MRRFLNTICISTVAIVLSLFCQSQDTLCFASNPIEPEREHFVVDQYGRYIVPPTTCQWLKYLGCGLYAAQRRDGSLPDLLYLSGKKIKYKLPPGAQFQCIVADDGKTNACEDPEKSAVIFFSLDAPEQAHKEGVCDFNGNILLPARERHFNKYLNDGVVLAMDTDFTRLTMLNLHGRILGQMNVKNNDGYMLPRGDFADNLCTIEKNAKNPGSSNNKALIDIHGNIIAKNKFCFINTFQNGQALAGSVIGTDVQISLINKNGVKKKTFKSNICVESCRGSDCMPYYKTNTKPILWGLIGPNGDILTPAKYVSVPFLYGKYHIARLGQTELDVYDARGKLLWHGPQQEGKDGELSAFSQFLLDCEGAIIRRDPSYPSSDHAHQGLYAKSGKWLVEPKYSSESFFTDQGVDPPVNQYYFAKRE